MKKNISKFIVIFLLISYLGISDLSARTINVPSCSQSDVQMAIDMAVSGDMVIIPSGSCTWTSGVQIPDDKRIILQGAGYDKTIITSSVTMIKMNKSGSRVTGIGFVLTGSAEIINVKGTGWRIDHCMFTNQTTSNQVGVHANGYNVTVPPEGLIDNCIFNNCRVLVNGLGNFGTMSTIWANPLNLGTSEAVYVEDCVFNYDKRGNCMDANRGGRYVFRYNTVVDSRIEAHSLQSDAERATRKWEIYNNNISCSSSFWGPFLIRGGTGVIFNNKITGPWTDKNIILDNVRSCQSIGSAGKCDGTSLWDGNEPGESGYPCRDQIGRSTDQWLWTTSNPYPPQALEPAYFWNNKYGESEIGVTLHNCEASKNHIQQNRDWYLGIPKPGYTPYTYPHPLRQPQYWGTSLEPPKNLRITE